MRSGLRPADRRLVRALGERLEAAASQESRAFWERYLGGAVPFRGVPMGAIRRAVHAWWIVDGPAALSVPEQKALALTLFEMDHCEDKLAGTLALQELLLDELTLRDVETLGSVFDRGLIADWNTCDWFCVKVLGSLVARDLPARALADAIASWRDATTLWQRRAANVAFVNLAKRGEQNFPGFIRLMLETCAVTVRSPERFAQTGVGWLLRELADADREAVLGFAEENLGAMSREGVRYVVERMPDAVRARILAKHGQRRDRPRGRLAIDPRTPQPPRRPVTARIPLRPGTARPEDVAMPDSDLLTAAKIAAALKVSDARVKRAIAALKLKPTAKKGVCCLYARADVARIRKALT